MNDHADPLQASHHLVLSEDRDKGDPSRRVPNVCLMTPLLFVHAGADHARGRFRAEGIPYWTMGLPAVLEQHGLLGFEVDSERRLRDSDIWAQGRLLIIGRLPDEMWTNDLITRLVTSEAQVLVEGPLPQSVHEALGLRDEGPAAATATIRTPHERIRKAGWRYGLIPESALGLASTRQLPHDPTRAWTALDVPITSDQAASLAKDRLGSGSNGLASSGRGSTLGVGRVRRVRDARHRSVGQRLCNEL